MKYLHLVIVGILCTIIQTNSMAGGDIRFYATNTSSTDVSIQCWDVGFCVRNPKASTIKSGANQVNFYTAKESLCPPTNEKWTCYLAVNGKTGWADKKSFKVIDVPGNPGVFINISPDWQMTITGQTQ